MRELRKLLPSWPLASPPPVDAVAARAGRYRARRQMRMTASAAALVGVLGVTQLVVADDGRGGQSVRTAGPAASGDNLTGTDGTLPPPLGDLLGGTTTTTSTTSTSTTSTTVRPSGNPDACPSGRNAGATDVGVSGERITVVTRHPMLGAQAYAQRVNQAGGVCGRRIEVREDDRAGFPAPGTYFAFIPGLVDSTASHGSLSLPAVGGEGWAAGEYGSSWSWPVGTSVAAQVRIMVKHAHDNGARTFGMVHDSGRSWGNEAATAFRSYVKTLTGSDPKAVVGLAPGRTSYNSEAQAFDSACGCDFVALAVLPDTALTFVASRSQERFGTMLTGGISALMKDRFALDCGAACADMLVWTPFNPPIGRLAEDPDVAAYVEDVRSVSASADVNDQTIERSYVAVRVLVAALQDAGANVTRARVQEALDRLVFSSGLTSTLDWTPNRRANQRAQAFRITRSSGAFRGWANEATGFLGDPAPE